MPSYTEDTYHDRQATGSTASQDTTLIDTYEDITGAALTTKEIAEIGNYTAFIGILLSASLNNTIANVEIIEDGVSLGDNDIILRFAGVDVGYPVFFLLPNVICCKEMKLRIKTDKGVVTISEFSFLIDGVPSTRVID